MKLVGEIKLWWDRINWRATRAANINKLDFPTLVFSNHFHYALSHFRAITSVFFSEHEMNAMQYPVLAVFVLTGEFARQEFHILAVV